MPDPSFHDLLINLFNRLDQHAVRLESRMEKIQDTVHLAVVNVESIKTALAQQQSTLAANQTSVTALEKRVEVLDRFKWLLTIIAAGIGWVANLMFSHWMK